MEEIWKNIGIIKGIDYTGLYQVSNYGQVRSLDRYVFDKIGRRHFYKGIIREPNINKHGYLFINLSKYNKDIVIAINRLVALTFDLPIPEELKDIPIEDLEVDHIDGNRANNNILNLRWVDHYGNMQNPIKRQRLSNSLKGRKILEEWKEKSRKARTNHPSFSKAVLQYDLDGNFIKEYPSSNEAARQLHISAGHIRYCCSGKEKTCGGFKWSFK